MTTSDLEFEPPRPGLWRLAAGHSRRPATRYRISFGGEPMERGMNETAARYGTLTERRTAVIHRFPYISQGPAAKPADDEFDRRVDRIAETFQTARWNADVDRWFNEDKPTLTNRCQTLVDTDPESLDDAGLIEHIETCRDLRIEAAVKHFQTFPLLTVTVGDFLAQTANWTDRHPSDLLALLDGTTPASAGPTSELEVLITAIQSDEVAHTRLFADDPPDAILHDLADHDDPVGTAMTEWLSIAGYRTFSGYSLTDAYGLEHPDTLVRSLRTAIDDGVDANPNPWLTVSTVRSEVPARQREAFDDLLETAQTAYPLRDDTTLVMLWAQGLLRRGLLEAGRRLADRDHLHDPEHVVEYTPSELTPALEHGGGPTADTIADHVEYRLTHHADDVPAQLGTEPDPPFDIDDLPEPMARAHRAAKAVNKARTRDRSEDTGHEAPVEGLAASSGTYQGRARVVSGPDDFSAIEDGDILVAEATSSAFNVLLPMLGGIVTDTGGMLSHPAIVAREFGIPAVVGCEDATERIQDDTQIRIDGEAGTVHFESESDTFDPLA